MNLESLIVFVVVLGVLVVFHELGHFIAAKFSGMRVDEFAFGFGPKLVTVAKHRETEYTIHAFPLGGFVRITGMEPGDEDVEGGFQAQPLWKRALVIFSGPFFSFVLAVMVFQFVGLFWGFQDETKTLNKVLVAQPNTVASRIGLRAGDQILEINGTKVTDGARMVEIIHQNPGKRITLVVKHDGHVSTRTAIPSWFIGYLGASWSFMNDDQAVVQAVEPKSDAAKTGIKTDDKLVGINGRTIVGGSQMETAIKANGTKVADMTLLRGGKTVNVKIHPSIQSVDFAGAKWYFPGAQAYTIDRKNPQSRKFRVADELVSIGGVKIKTGQELVEVARGGPLDGVLKRDREEKPITVTVDPGKVTPAVYEAMGLLGFQPQYAFVKMGFVESIQAGWLGTVRLVQAIFAALAPSHISENVGGPLMIAKQTSTLVELGPYYVVQMGGMLSMSLAVINLIPIPLFDGGHLALLAIEGARRRKLTREQMQYVQMVGFAIIILLAVAVFFSDITKIVGGQIPQ